jgi:hypothetical protein
MPLRPPPRRYLDVVVDRYVDWRNQCEYVRVAYDGWRQAGRGERSQAFAVYTTALEHEQRASDSYAAAMARAGSMRPLRSVHGL